MSMNLSVSTRPDLQTELTRHKAAFGAVFPNWDKDPLHRALNGEPTTDLQKRVEPILGSVFNGVNASLDAIDEIKTNVTAVQAQAGFLTPQAIASESNKKVREGQRAYISGLAAATAAVDTLSGEFARIGKVQRPQPADAAQEAALGNLRADLRMLLDHLKGGDITARLAELAGEAAANSDQLRTWFLSATEWPTDYLTARGLAGDAPQGRHMISQAIAPHMGKERGQALTGYRLTEEGKKGLRRLVDAWVPSVWELEMSNIIKPLLDTKP